MNIRFIGIDGLGEHEVNRTFLPLKDFDFIKSVGIREFNNSCGEVIYDVTIETEPVYRDDVSIHIFDNSIYIVDYECRQQTCIYIDRSDYEGLEII